MTTIPTDPIGLAAFITGMLLEAIANIEAGQKLAHGVAATAQAEDRDVTEIEQAIINAALADSEKRRRGQ